MAKSDEQVIKEFDEAVNMTRKELEEWLRTDESKSVGRGGGESKGHESGRRIVEILDKNKSDYTDVDIGHMRRVVSYVHRHQAQKPEGGVEDSRTLSEKCFEILTDYYRYYERQLAQS